MKFCFQKWKGFDHEEVGRNIQLLSLKLVLPGQSAIGGFVDYQSIKLTYSN